MKKKLVVFDLDGTLIHSLAPGGSLQRFPYAIKKIFKKDIPVALSMWKQYDGWGDRAVLWDLVKASGISQKKFIGSIDEVGRVFAHYLENQSGGKPLYEVIPKAKEFYDRVMRAPHLETAILTGNLEQSALWKMRHAGISENIAFGVYGQEAHDRIGLAKLVIPKAKKTLGITFSGQDIYFVGDTVFDIRAGRAIGATTVAVATGPFTDKKKILLEKPDVFVQSLLDEALLKLLDISVEK